MITSRIIILLACFHFSLSVHSQTDSTSVSAILGFRGMLQTGNLDQFNLMPNATIKFKDDIHFVEFISNYHLIKIDGFVAKNDLWAYCLYQFRSDRGLFFSLNSVTGFAASYKINHSVVAGIGVGLNLIQKEPQQYFQFHLFNSYLDMQLEGIDRVSSYALGSLVRAKFPIGKLLLFNWELGSYHSFSASNFWGGSNLMQLVFRLNSAFAININHQSYYNYQSATDLERTNTQLLLGIQYSFN